MRTVSLAPSNTEILYAIGAGGEVVATTSLCDHPPGAREKPSIGGWSSGLDIEKVVSLEPDIAFASDDLQDAVVERLEDRGVDVVQVKPHTLEEVFGSIEAIGEAVAREEEARKLAESMRSRLEELSIPGVRVYCEEWMEPPMVSGNWIPGIVERLGGEYFIDEGERSREFDQESRDRFDPEHIFLNVCGAGENVDTGKVRKREGWTDITAVREGNIHVIDDALLNRPGPRLVKGAEKIVDRL
ncbi:MAG: cobalamin-binding protein [Candidatus Nanohaloarchaea archaeon]